MDAVKIEHELNRHVVLSSLKGDASDSASVRALRDLQQWAKSIHNLIHNS